MNEYINNFVKISIFNCAIFVPFVSYYILSIFIYVLLHLFIFTFIYAFLHLFIFTFIYAFLLFFFFFVYVNKVGGANLSMQDWLNRIVIIIGCTTGY